MLITKSKVNKLKYTSDKDLVELAGFQVYKKYDEGKKLVVNRNKYWVMDTSYNNPNGLDAMTVQNVETGEYTVVFQGTQIKAKYGMQDLVTDIQLLGSTEPEQVKAARAYFDRMNEKYSVRSVCGNSLGGALANAVAVHHRDVRAVTIDPAILPEGMAKPNHKYPNVTNYFTKYDGLTRGELGLNLGDRFPGRIYRINSGVPYFSRAFASNHVGYNGEDPQYIKIGHKGEPGYGKIYIAADEHIVTSIWTGEPLYGGNGSGQIKINKANLDTLVDGLGSQVLDRLKHAINYIQNANEIVSAEKAQRARRLAKLEKQFENILEDGFGNSPLFKGIATGGYMIESVLDHLEQRLLTAEIYCRSVEKAMFSPPGKIAPFVSVKDLGISGMFNQALRYVHDLRRHFDQFGCNASKIVKQEIPRLLANEATGLVDTVVDEFYKHEAMVGKNNQKLYHQIEAYRRQVRQVGKSFQATDSAVAAGIRNGISPSKQISVQSAEVQPFDSSNDLPYKTKTKAIQVNYAKSELGIMLQVEVTPVVTIIYTALTALEGILVSISTSMKIASHAIWYTSIPAMLIGLFTDWDDRLKRKIGSATKTLDEIVETLHSMLKGVGNLQAYLPNLVSAYVPFIENAVFNNGRYADVITYNGAAAGSLEELELLFKDIVRQLSDQQAKSITALESQSKMILKNIKLLRADVQCGA